MIIRRYARILMLTAAGCTPMAGAAIAQTLTIGVAAEPTSIDPHFFRSGPNISIRENISDALVYNNQVTGEVEPRLASEWKIIDDKNWSFKLNPNAKFADGKAVTAADVIYSLCRVRNVVGSPGPYISFVETLSNVAPDGDGAVKVTTTAPDPVLLQSLSTIGIIQNTTGKTLAYDRKNCGNDSWGVTERFNRGEVSTGIAPYRVTEYTPGIQTVLQRNDNYYGAKPFYEKVVMRAIPENGARIAALLSGGVDVIDNVPVNAIDQIEANQGLQLISTPATRLIFFAFDQASENAPKTGRTKGNPFKDKRVREALNLGIDRQAIVDTIMDGIAEPAASIVMANVFGANHDLQVLPYDPKRAKALLAEAVYPDGFDITVSSPNDRYRNDSEVAQAVTQMLTQIGLKATLETVPQNVYFDRASKYEYGFFMGGAGADSGEGMSQLLNLTHSRDPARGLGGANRGRYSSPIADKYLDEALMTLDQEKRRVMLQQAQKQMYDDYGMVPLYHEVAVWGASKKVRFEPNAAQINILYTARPSSK